MEKWKELLLSPEEIFFIGKEVKGKYLDYDYIAAMRDIGKQGKIRREEIMAGLEKKGYAQEDFLGNLEIDPICLELLLPLYQGAYEAELIVKEAERQVLHYKFHHMEEKISLVNCYAGEFRVRNCDKKEIERLLFSFSEKSEEMEKGEKYIPADQAKRSFILKGTQIGKRACLYFYAEKDGNFYEMDVDRAEEKLLHFVKKDSFDQLAKKVLMRG